MTRTGSCLCGAVTYRVTDLPTHIGACHCQMCRKHTGGVFLSLRVAGDRITFAGEQAIATYTSSDWAERAFCGTCGSTLYYRVTAPGPYQGDYHIGFGTLDDTSGITLTDEIFIDKKPAGYAFAGQHKTMTEAEVFAQFAPPED